MSIDAILTQLLMGLTVGVNLVLVATDLTLVFDMMEIRERGSARDDGDPLAEALATGLRDDPVTPGRPPGAGG